MTGKGSSHRLTTYTPQIFNLPPTHITLFALCHLLTYTHTHTHTHTYAYRSFDSSNWRTKGNVV